MRCCRWPDTASTESEHRILNDSDSSIFSDTATSSANVALKEALRDGVDYLDMSVNKYCTSGSFQRYPRSATVDVLHISDDL